MLCVMYLRRRLVMLGISLWVTTLLFAYSFLTREAELMEVRQSFNRVLRISEPRDHILLSQMTNHVVPKQTVLVKPANQFQDRKAGADQVQYLSVNRNSKVEGRREIKSRDTLSLSPWPSILKYCNQESDMSLSQEGNLQSKDYKLLSVHIITRHGDRSPMYSFSRHPNPHLSCKFDPQEVKDNPRLATYIDTMRHWEGRQRGNSGFHGWALYPGRKICDTSQLTPTGAKQMLNMGYLMQERYVKRWGLLDSTFPPEQLAVRSTEYSRTYQSAIAFLYGFLPRFNLTAIPVTRSSSFFFCSEQAVSGPCTCPVLVGLKKQADRTVVGLLKNNTRYKTLMQAVGEVYDITRNQLSWMWAIMDVFLAYTCNSLPLPCNKQNQCVTSDMASQLWDHVSNYTRQLTNDKKYRQYASLALHPLLSEIVENMKDVTNGKTPVRVNLLSGHGATLILPLSVVLGIDRGDWPRYASRLVIELYSQNDSKSYHIRVLSNGKDVTNDVVFCRGHVDNGLCPLEYFINFMQNDNLGQFEDNDYINLCYSPA